jgi:hypothetical protein
MKYTLFYVGLLLLSTCCKKDKSLLNHDELSINRQVFMGDELRIDGYYYKESSGKLFSSSFFIKMGCF